LVFGVVLDGYFVVKKRCSDLVKELGDLKALREGVGRGVSEDILDYFNRTGV
jgi:hypothetical protein